MQHDHVLKKLIVDLLTPTLLTPTPGSGVRVGVGRGLRENICYHAAAIVIPFNLICIICCTLLCVHCSFAIIFIGKRELDDLRSLSSWCFMMVVSVTMSNEGNIRISDGCINASVCKVLVVHLVTYMN